VFSLREWKNVKGFNDNYSVSSDGEVRNNKSRRLLKKSPRPKGYLAVTLYAGRVDTRKSFLVHRLVAEAFLGESELQVNHKDLNKQNNSASNLEYCTNLENMQHAVVNGVYDEDNKRRRVKVEQVDPFTGEVVKVWNSITEAKQAGYSSVDNVIRGRGKSSKGYYWRYLK
jgi:hypothetical protein